MCVGFLCPCAFARAPMHILAGGGGADVHTADMIIVSLTGDFLFFMPHNQ